MAVERISPVVMLPARPLGPGDAQVPTALALPALEVLAQAAGAELAGLEAAVRAQATDGAPAAAPPAAQGTGAPANADALPGAMRFDQVALRQVAWSVPDPARLASTWRATLAHALENPANVAERGRAADTAAGAALAGQAIADAASAGAGGSVARPVAAAALPGWINVYAWGGMQVMLGLAAIDGDEAPPARRRAPLPALRFALEVPGLGRIVACMHLAAGGLMLDLAAETPALMQHLRDSLPAVAAAFARAELRLLRCRLIDPAGLAAQARIATGLPPSLALSPALFRAATALWAVLAPPLAAVVVSPPFR
jgi:hypothetical protein